MKRIIVMICVIAIIISSAIAFVGCDKKTEEQGTANNVLPPWNDSTYRANGTVFDFGDITIEWSFGWEYIPRQERGKKTSYIELYFFQSESENTHRFVKRIDEDFFSEKFMMEVDSTGKAEYHYTETVTIPQKYFLSPKGRITLIVKGVEKLPNGEIEDRVFIVTDLYYVAHDDKIELVSHDKWYQYIILS